MDIEKYVKVQPTFHIQELKEHLQFKLPDLMNTSGSTICRVLNFDLQLSRKSLQKLWEKLFWKKLKIIMRNWKQYIAFWNSLFLLTKHQKMNMMYFANSPDLNWILRQQWDYLLVVVIVYLSLLLWTILDFWCRSVPVEIFHEKDFTMHLVNKYEHFLICDQV